MLLMPIQKTYGIREWSLQMKSFSQEKVLGKYCHFQNLLLKSYIAAMKIT